MAALQTWFRSLGIVQQTGVVAGLGFGVVLFAVGLTAENWFLAALGFLWLFVCAGFLRVAAEGELG